MALERVPADIRVEGGVARMSDPSMIKEIMEAVTIPVMAKARIGHFVECQVCEQLSLCGGGADRQMEAKAEISGGGGGEQTVTILLTNTDI
jgi:hypothetical protein